MTDTPKKYPPSVTIARLYERTSKTGNTYLAGRLGLARVAILKTNQTDDEGNAIWEVRLSETPQTDKQDARGGSRAGGDNQAKRDWQRPARTTTDEPSDLIPF
jgi:hypothetical protein